MMFAGRAAGANADILFDSAASHNYVSTKFAKLTGVTVSPSLQTIRLGSDQEVSPDDEAVVYIPVGTFNQHVKCLVMNLLFEVDVILGDEFMDKYDCVLHYGRRCIQIRNGRKHITVKSPPMHRKSPSDFEAVPKVMSASQLRRAVRQGERVFLATLKSLDSDTTASDSTTSFGQLDCLAGEKPWVSDLIGHFFEVFQDPLPDGLPPIRKEVHGIPTEPGHPPPFRQMYRLSPLEYRELEKQVTAFLKAGILEVSTSPYGAPVLFVPKPNGRGLRLCVDYRALNAITIKNRCTIPRIDDLLDAVAGSKYFTSLDLTSGYHQILISEEDRPKTAFRTPFGHFQFKVLIEGLTNAPATFQTAMNSIFHPFLRKFVVVYIDDILIFSRNEEEHKAHVRLVLDILKREKFYVCKSKSTFAKEEVKFLGHIVDAEGIRPDPKKVSAVQDWPVPRNVHEIKSFIGLACYFKKFISHYSEVAVPLTNLTRKSHVWEWTGKCQDAFEKLKLLLTEAPLLRTPDPTKLYRCVTDASDFGLGAVLLQEGHPIAFESRKLNSAEQNYTTTEREMLAVVHALRVWQCYLEGVYFEVETDHKCNTFFQSQPNLSRRQARWSEFLQRFGKFKWDYRPGEQNVADALSRRDVATTSQQVVSDNAMHTLAVCAAAIASEMYVRGSKPGQAEPLGRDQRGDSNLTFDLPLPLLKSLIHESRGLRESISSELGPWLSKSPELSVNLQGLVVKGLK